MTAGFHFGKKTDTALQGSGICGVKRRKL